MPPALDSGQDFKSFGLFFSFLFFLFMQIIMTLLMRQHAHMLGRPKTCIPETNPMHHNATLPVQSAILEKPVFDVYCHPILLYISFGVASYTTHAP